MNEFLFVAFIALKTIVVKNSDFVVCCWQAEGDPTFLVLLDSRRLRVAGETLDALFVDDELAALHSLGADNVVFIVVVVMVVAMAAGGANFELPLECADIGADTGACAGARTGSDNGANHQRVLAVVTAEITRVVLSNDGLVHNFNVRVSAARRSTWMHIDNEWCR